MKYSCIKFLNINIVRNRCYETLIGRAWSVLTTAKISLSRGICSFKRVLILVCGSKAGVWKSRNPESGIRSRKRNRNRNRNLNWDQGKLGSTETSSRYPCGNKIQDGVLCYHCFEQFSAQWSWYQRYTHIRKVTCKKKVSASYCYS